MDRTQPKIPHSKDLRINRTRHPAKASALKNAETAALGKSPFGVSSGRRQTSFTLKSWARSLLALMKLREAIINEDISAVTKSLNSGINPNIQIGKTLNPLVAAVEVDNLELIQLLLNAGADVNLPLEHGHFGSVLVAACYHGNHKSVELLLEAGATVDMQVLHGDYGTALVAACCSETTKSAEILLDAGANPNFQVKNGTFGSALAAACCYLTATTLVPLLLEAGADPNLPLLYGNYGNAISSAIRNKSRSAAKSLLTYNAFLERFSDNLLSQIPGWGEEYSTGLSSGTSELIIFGTESWGADMHSVDFQEGKEELWLSSTVALIWQDDTIKLTTLWDWLNRFVSPSLGLRLLNGIRRALKYERDQFYINGDFYLQFIGSRLIMQTTGINRGLFDALEWICLTVRQALPDSISISKITDRRTVHPRTVYDLAELKPFPQHADDHNCWQKLFDSAVVAENHGQQPCRGLEVDFNTLVQLAAVEYPVSVGYGLVLMGYSTALVPIQETNDGMILWHLEVSDDDFQLQVADLVVMHQNDWLKTQDLEYLQSKTALLGWCTKARVLLGTDHIDPHVNWSGAQNKPTSWHWKGANLQLVAQSASPLQIGCQAGMSFDRTINTVRYNPSRNYLKCLQSSAAEQIVLYDVSAKRAWLVSLLAVLHHMLLVYCDSINEEFRANLPPRATEPLNGVSASLDVLSNAGGLIIQGTKEDSLTVRELIMGFSVNLSRASLHKPKGAQIYGYEFMDIVMDSPQSELKKQKLERNGLSWSSFLNEVKCLFCSNLGEVIVGARALVLSSPCNSIPGGYDFLAASMHSIEGLSAKSGGAHEGKTRRISANRFWNLTGDPFERCKHVKGHESCWQQPGCLQEIDGRRNHPSSSRERPLTEYINGALVFGEPVKSRKRETSLLFSGMYQSQTVTNDDIPTGEVQVGMEHNPTLDHAFPRMEMDF